MTFRTFSTPDKVFELLTDLYRMDSPAGVNQMEFREWREKRFHPTRKRVLTVLTMWLEDHGLLQEEPHIAQRLTDFLTQIVEPSPLALTAKLMLQSLERLVRFISFTLRVLRLALTILIDVCKPQCQCFSVHITSQAPEDQTA
jgi:hypothetical protein